MKWKKDEPQNRKIETLADKIRGVAYESIENLWNAFLDLAWTWCGPWRKTHGPW